MKTIPSLAFQAFVFFSIIALLTACSNKKDNNNQPAYTVTARVDNINGNEIHFASSSGNMATLINSTGELQLHFIDSKTKLTLDIDALPANTTGDINLTGKTHNEAHLVIGSNPSGKQSFCTCTDVNGDGIADGHGTLTIITLTSDHITGTFDQVALLSSNLSLASAGIYDGKFNLKLVRK